MNDDQKLSLLDRRAAAATAALDEAVQQVPVPDPDLGAPRRSLRRLLPLAVAAGLTVVALVGAVLVFDDDEQSTIAEQPAGITHLALPDPESLGYQVVGAFDGDNPDDRMPRDLVTPLTIQSPTGAEDPWTTTVVSYSLSTDMTTLDGEPVDVGGPEATLDSSNGPLTVGWIDEPRVHYLRSASMTAGELVALARSAVADRTADGEPLPGHEIVHAAPHTDVFPVLSSATAAAASGLDGIVYSTDNGGFVVATGEGSIDRWTAAHTLAVSTTRATVRGRDAVIADFGNGLVEVSWLEADGTLVRVNPLGGRAPIEHLDQLEPISDADFAALVGEYDAPMDEIDGLERQDEDTHDPSDASSEDSSDDSPDADANRTLIAEVSEQAGGVAIRATLLRRGESYSFETFSEGSNGGSGSGQPLADVSSNVVIRDVVQAGGSAIQGELIGGVIGPDVGPLRILDAATGEPIEASGPSTATIDGSDHVVFLATVSDEYRDRDLVVVGTTSAGEEVRLSAPAQP